VQVGRDGTLVAGGSRTLVALDTATGTRRWTADITGNHPDPCPWLTSSERAGAVYCGNYYGEVVERNRDTGQLTADDHSPQLGAVGDLAVTSDGSRLVAFGEQTPAISQWALDGSGPINRLVARGRSLADGYDFADAGTLVVTERDRTDRASPDYAIWDVAADRELDPLEVDMEGVGWIGRNVLVGMRVPQLRVGWYDTQSRQLVSGDRLGPECERLWPSRSGLAWCTVEGEVWTIDPTTRRRVEPTLQVDGLAWYVSGTRDNERVVATVRGERELTTVHDGDTGERVSGPLVGPETTAVSLDGTLVGSESGEITRYDLDTLEPVADLPGAGGEVNTLQFSDDGELLLATSNDQSASLYDVASGTRLGDPIPTNAPLSYPAYLRPDGRQLALTSEQGVQVWDLDPDRLRGAACRLAGRNLTPAEWSSYLSDLGQPRATCPR
jgi:WD40 repeat protein